MLIPVVCFTCGLPIADKIDLYNHLVNKNIPDKKNISDEKFAELCIPILSQLDIFMPCCRMHFISHMKISDYI